MTCDLNSYTILDTGFTDSLTLPSSLITRLGLVWRSRSNAIRTSGVAASLAIDPIMMIGGKQQDFIVAAAEDHVEVVQHVSSRHRRTTTTHPRFA